MNGLLPDWWNHKDHAVLKAVQVFGTVKGRKALHKILYFAGLKTNLFKYQWYEYGPYSPELSYKITDHVFDQSLDVKGARYDMSLSASGGRMLGRSRYKELDSAILWAHEILGKDMPPRQLELVASVHYLLSCVGEQNKVHGFMERLKPAANFTAGDVEQALRFLEEKSVIERSPALLDERL